MTLTTTTGADVPVPGIVVLPAADGARSFIARTLTAGQSVRLQVSVFAAHSHPLPGRAVSLFDGDVVRSSRANRDGVASFTVPSLTDRVTRSYIVYSGRAWRTLEINAPAAPKLTIQLLVSPRHPRAHAKVRLSIFTRESGRPVGRVDLELVVATAAGPLIRPERLRTNHAGRLTVSFPEPKTSTAIVAVTTRTSSATLTVR